MTRTEQEPWREVIEAGRGDQLVTESRWGARPAEREPLPSDLHPALEKALRGSGVEALYSHQAETLAAARRGHTVVTTGTASGKSLAFNLPVLDTLAHDMRARALYLYPTKALAQDQARALHSLRAPFLRPAIYDGDTPREERKAIRGRSNLILTNPDMLHLGVLPNHRPWGDMFANLAWVVVDEAHVYRGVFGSHVGNVLRRLRRLANAYGTEPRFILTSATIANPEELAERLTGLEFRLVDSDGAPRAERKVAMWNPPLLDEAKGTRGSALSEAAGLLADLVERGARTICFLKSRRGVELIQRFTRLKLEDRGRGDLADRVAPYRAGYTPSQRREIERRLVEGELLGVAATSALELGIDVGELDGVGDRGAGENEARLGAVGVSEPSQSAQHVGHVRAEHASVGVSLVDHHEGEVREDVAPVAVVREDAHIEHVGVGEDQVAASADGPALLARGVAVVDRRAQEGRAQRVELAGLVLSERLGRVEVERAGGAIAGEDVEDRQVEGERLAAGGAGGDDGVATVEGGGVGLGLVRPEMLDAGPAQRGGDGGV